MSIDLKYYDLSNYIACTLSLTASAWLIFKVQKLSNLTLSMDFIKQIAIADLIQSFFLIVMPSIPFFIKHCEPQEFVLIATNWASLFWSSALAIYSFKMITDSEFNNRRFYQITQSVIPILALAIAAIPLIFTSFIEYSFKDETLDVCVVLPNQSYSQTIQTLLVSIYQGLPVAIALTISIICYSLEILALKKSYPPNIIKALNIRVQNLAWYPLTQILIYAPHGFIIIYVSATNEIGTVPVFICFILYRLGGLVNTIVFVYIRYSQQKKEEERENSSASVSFEGKNIPLSDTSYPDAVLLQKCLSDRTCKVPSENNNSIRVSYSIEKKSSVEISSRSGSQFVG